MWIRSCALFFILCLTLTGCSRQEEEKSEIDKRREQREAEWQQSLAKKEIKTLRASDLNLKDEEVGLSGSDIQLEKVFLPSVGEGAQMLEGKPEEIAQRVFDILKDKGGLA